MHRRTLLTSTLALAALSGRGAWAQNPARVARVGWVTAQREASLTSYLAIVRASLADLGYIEGRNLALEFRYGDDVIERVPGLVDELTRLPVDVLVAQGDAATSVKALGPKIPVVYVISGDPVSSGFAESLARPQGNMTGITFMAAEYNGKRLELLQELVPGLRRIAVIANPEHPGEDLERRNVEERGRQLKLTTEYYPTPNLDTLQGAFRTIASSPPQAMLVFGDGFALQNRRIIIDFATGLRTPVISAWPAFAHSGAVCTYGPHLGESYRRLAHYVDRILRGAKPADLPIERPSKTQTIVNLRAAKNLGLTVPPTLLARADEVIE